MTKKSGLHLSKAYEIQRKLFKIIDGIVAVAISDHRDFEWMCGRMSHIYQTPDFKRLPAWGRQSISAYFNGQLNVITTALTVHAFRYKSRLYRLRAEDGPRAPNWPVVRTLDFTVPAAEQPIQFEDRGWFWPDGKPFDVTPSPVVISADCVSFDVSHIFSMTEA
jgi:hypothetical protein